MWKNFIVKITQNKMINEKSFLKNQKEKKISNLMFSKESQFFTRKYKPT